VVSVPEDGASGSIDAVGERVEACDLLSSDKHLICVKRLDGSGEVRRRQPCACPPDRPPTTGPNP